jgi:hypothetical protein
MPSGPPELHEKWGDDGAALRYLDQHGIKSDRGGMLHGPTDRELTEEENSAVTYLVLEWDYGYTPRYEDKHLYVPADRNNTP